MAPLRAKVENWHNNFAVLGERKGDWSESPKKTNPKWSAVSFLKQQFDSQAQDNSTRINYMFETISI